MTLIINETILFVGGVTLLRAAAKNHKYVTVICDPSDYDRYEFVPFFIFEPCEAYFMSISSFNKKISSSSSCII